MGVTRNASSAPHTRHNSVDSNVQQRSSSTSSTSSPQAGQRNSNCSIQNGDMHGFTSTVKNLTEAENISENHRSSEKSSSSKSRSSDAGSHVKKGNTRYKTELCRAWLDGKTCKYGDKCQFAHGKEELRPIQRHPKYKTEFCRTFHSTGVCPYGPRCHFIHEIEQDSVLRQLNTAASSQSEHESQMRPQSQRRTKQRHHSGSKNQRQKGQQSQQHDNRMQAHHVNDAVTSSSMPFQSYHDANVYTNATSREQRNHPLHSHVHNQPQPSPVTQVSLSQQGMPAPQESSQMRYSSSSPTSAVEYKLHNGLSSALSQLQIGPPSYHGSYNGSGRASPFNDFQPYHLDSTSLPLNLLSDNTVSAHTLPANSTYSWHVNDFTDNVNLFPAFQTEQFEGMVPSTVHNTTGGVPDYMLKSNQPLNQQFRFREEAGQASRNTNPRHYQSTFVPFSYEDKHPDSSLIDNKTQIGAHGYPSSSMLEQVQSVGINDSLPSKSRLGTAGSGVMPGAPRSLKVEPPLDFAFGETHDTASRVVCSALDDDDALLNLGHGGTIWSLQQASSSSDRIDPQRHGYQPTKAAGFQHSNPWSKPNQGQDNGNKIGDISYTNTGHLSSSFLQYPSHGWEMPQENSGTWKVLDDGNRNIHLGTHQQQYDLHDKQRIHHEM